MMVLSLICLISSSSMPMITTERKTIRKKERKKEKKFIFSTAAYMSNHILLEQCNTSKSAYAFTSSLFNRIKKSNFLWKINLFALRISTYASGSRSELYEHLLKLQLYILSFSSQRGLRGMQGKIYIYKFLQSSSAYR
jgi:hypothetical protein